MKLLLCTDIHGDAKLMDKIQKAARNVDAIACLGDISVFEQDLQKLLEWMDGFGIPVLMLHGNHEEERHMRKRCKKLKNTTFLHNEHVVMNGWTFAAFGGGGFSEEYPELETAWNWDVDWGKMIFLAHAPPYGTRLDILDEDWHVGNMTLRRLIEEKQPYLVAAGHIHECFGEEDHIGKTRILNPGQEGMVVNL